MDRRLVDIIATTLTWDVKSHGDVEPSWARGFLARKRLWLD